MYQFFNFYAGLQSEELSHNSSVFEHINEVDMHIMRVYILALTCTTSKEDITMRIYHCNNSCLSIGCRALFMVTMCTSE